MKLPISTTVAIIIVVIALAAIVAFFWAMGGGAAGRTEMQKQFTEGCLLLCGLEEKTATAGRAAYIAYDNWRYACEQLYGLPGSPHLQCLERCACATLPTLCDKIQSLARDVADDCLTICDLAAAHPAYKDCECKCE